MPFKKTNNQTENISEVIISCFALHNFCLLENEEFIDQDGKTYHAKTCGKKQEKRTKWKSKSTRRRSCTNCHKKQSHGKCLKTN